MTLLGFEMAVAVGEGLGKAIWFGSRDGSDGRRPGR
jgi:hypothetical protein